MMNTHTITQGQAQPENGAQQWGAFDESGKLRATFDSESEAHFYVRNRGHMHGGSHRAIQAHAERLAEALRRVVKVSGKLTMGVDGVTFADTILITEAKQAIANYDQEVRAK